MLQQDKPDDYVIATGVQYSVREFVERAGALLGYDVEWQGEGLEEKGIDKNSGKVLVKVEERYMRPAEVETLLGDASKAQKQLGWTPKTSFEELVEVMLRAEFEEMGVEANEHMK